MFCADHMFHLSCFNSDHQFRNCPKVLNSAKYGCKSTQNFLLRGAFSNNLLSLNKSLIKHLINLLIILYASTAALNFDQTSATTISCSLSIGDFKSLLQWIELKLSSKNKTVNALVFCHYACSYTCLSASLANRIDFLSSVVSRQLLRSKMKP